MPRELFQDAAALEETIAQQQQQQQEGADGSWQEWPLLATDGDTAFLLELASEGKVRRALCAHIPKRRGAERRAVSRSGLMSIHPTRGACGRLLIGIARKQVRARAGVFADADCYRLFDC